MNIRGWEEKDREQLMPMVQATLQENFDTTADMLPSTYNSKVLIDLGMARVQFGDPCLVAEEDGVLLGYVQWCGIPDPLGLGWRMQTVHGFGTFVLPDHRRKGISTKLRDLAEEIAKAVGYQQVTGVAYNALGAATVMSRGFQIAGALVYKELK